MVERINMFYWTILLASLCGGVLSAYVIVLRGRIVDLKRLVDHHKMEQIADNAIRHAHEVLDENRAIYRQKIQESENVLQERETEISNLKYNEGI